MTWMRPFRKAPFVPVTNTYNFGVREIVPSGARQVVVEVWGAGGGGGNNAGIADGGGGGGYSAKTIAILVTDEGKLIPYARGIGGFGNTVGAGFAGENSSVTLSNLNGAPGAMTANGGGGGDPVGDVGGAGGTASGGTTNTTGSAGANSVGGAGGGTAANSTGGVPGGGGSGIDGAPGNRGRVKFAWT